MGAASSRTQGAVRALPPGGLMYFGVLPVISRISSFVLESSNAAFSLEILLSQQ